MEKPGVPRRLTEAGLQQRRMAAWKHGQRASRVTDADAFHYRLEQIDPELPEVLDQYVRAVSGDLSAADLELAVSMAWKAMIRRWLVERIFERGVEVEDILKDRDGKEIGRRIRANPMLKRLIHVDRQLGYTVDHAHLSRRSRAQGGPRDAAAAFADLLRDARLRAANKARSCSSPGSGEA